MAAGKTARSAKKKKMTNNPAMKLRCLITSLEKRLDKNQKDYWIIRTQSDQFTKKTYLAFGTDYNLSKKTLTFLINYPHLIVDHWAVLTIKKNEELEKVINLELDK